MAPIQPDKLLQITLQAQEWNVVLGALGEAPYRIAAPVIQKITAQVQEEPPPDPPALPSHANGEDHAHV